MAETSLKTYLFAGMLGLWQHPVKHCESFTIGVPDVSAFMPQCGTVWIELKDLPHWPKRPQTRVVVEPDPNRWALQRDFLEQRKGFLFLRVEREYLLFTWQALFVVNQENAEGLRNHAVCRWERRVNWQEFAACLKTYSR